MLVDRSHLKWGVFAAAATFAATGLYALVWAASPEGISGGSPLGLAYGIVAAVLMVLVGLLSVRKKTPRRRLGSAQWWLRAHIWLGLLTAPFVLLHAGFRFGGELETLLMIVYAVIMASGLFGVVLQQYAPRVMKDVSPHEAMPQQLANVCDSLRRLADQIVVDAYPEFATAIDLASHAGSETATDRRFALGRFYLRTVRPFLAAAIPPRTQLQNAALADAMFAQTHAALPPPTGEARGAAALHDALDRLNEICCERRNLLRQARIHRWLHGWLFIHVPLSAALLVLGAAHAIAALYY